MNDSTLLPLSASALGITGLATLPGLLAVLAQSRDRTPPENFYEDEDGKATPETMAAFSNKKPKRCVLTFSIFAFGLSISVAVLSMFQSLPYHLNLENWLIVGTTVSLTAGIFLHLRFFANQMSPHRRLPFFCNPSSSKRTIHQLNRTTSDSGLSSRASSRLWPLPLSAIIPLLSHLLLKSWSPLSE